MGRLPVTRGRSATSPCRYAHGGRCEHFVVDEGVFSDLAMQVRAWVGGGGNGKQVRGSAFT